MKRIVFAISSLSRRGPVQQLYALVGALDRAVFEPVVVQVSHEADQDMSADFRSLGIRVDALNLVGSVFWVKGRGAFRRYVRSVGADLVHTSGIRADWLGSGLAAGIPVVSTAHNIPRQDYHWRYGSVMARVMTAAQVRFWSSMRRVVCVSEYLQRDMRLHYPELRVDAVPNGVHVYSSRERTEACIPQKPIILSLDGFDHVKDPLTVLRGFNAYRSAGGAGVLVLLGDGPLRYTCYKEALTYGLRVGSAPAIVVEGGRSASPALSDIPEWLHRYDLVFGGRVDALQPWISVADVLVSASLSEGYHMAAAEGLCAGLVPVFSEIGVREELLRETGFESFIFSPGDFESLAALLRRSEQVGWEARLRSREVARGRYSIRRMGEGYARIYQEILHETSR